jgi:hypothetical protein
VKILMLCGMGLQYPHLYSFFSMALPAHSRPRPLIQFRKHFSQTVGFLGRVISPSQGRYLNREQHKHRITAYTHKTTKPSVGFEPTIRASERAKTVHALDREATVTGAHLYSMYNMAIIFGCMMKIHPLNSGVCCI